MKTRWMVTLLLAASISLTVGCSKKEPAKTPGGTDAETATGMMDSVKNAAADTVKSTTEAIKEKLSMDIDLDKTVSDLKAEAAKMDIESLKTIAAKYKDAITEKQDSLKSLMDKLSAIPMTEKMGTEAKSLTTEIKTLTDSIAPLKERLSVYVDAIKAKGGDVQGLTL